MDQKSPDISSQAEHLKKIVQKLLNRLEQALDEVCYGAGESSAEKQQAHERLFGNKTSLTSTLVNVAELLLKLEHAESKHHPSNHANNDSAERSLTPADIALVNSFIKKNMADIKDVDGEIVPEI